MFARACEPDDPNCEPDEPISLDAMKLARLKVALLSCETEAMSLAENPTLAVHRGNPR